MEILVVLVDRAGAIATKDELISALWPDSYVEESNLSQNVFLLRKALGESAQRPNYIATVPGKGYRFAAELHAVPVEPSPIAPPIPAQPTLAPATSGPVDPSTPPVARSRIRTLAVVIVLVMVAGFLLWWLREPKADARQRIVLAVLPFANMTGDSSQDYFSDGLTEEMIAQLGRLDPDRLGVIARTSVMRYKNAPEQLQLIGRELGVNYVLEGSVRRDSQKVRITAQLIQMKDQTHVWSREYDRDLTSLLIVQSAIASEIAHEIQITLNHHRQLALSPQLPLSADAYEAHDLYLKGRFFWNKRTLQGFRQSIDCFQRAIAKDPGYARAYAGLADSYVLMSSYDLVPAAEVMPKARAAAEHALELDASLAEAHASLALIAQNYAWDWKTAEAEYRRAIQLDPNYATAHHWFAEHLALRGRFEEALAEIERARQLDPFSLIISTDRGAIFYFARQYDRAAEQFRAVIDMEPNFPRAHMLVNAYAQQGRFDDALADIKLWQHYEKGPWIWAELAYIYGRSGQQAKAMQARNKLLQVYSRGQVDPAPMFVADIGLQKRDEALQWLQKAGKLHSGGLTALKVDPIYDPLRSEPGFQQLLQQLHLDQ